MKKSSFILAAFFILLSGIVEMSAQQVIGKGDYPSPVVYYRSFTQEPEMARIFSQELGIKNRCFFASNTINSLGGTYCEYPPIWVGLGKYEFEHFDAQMKEMIYSNPDGKLLCMIDLASPYWMIRQFGFDSFEDVSSAASNRTWKKKMTKWMTDFINYAEAHYGDRIEGYILSGGGTSEWYDRVNGYPTYSKERYWLEWCKERGLDYGNAVPPFPSLKEASFEGKLYDPVSEGAKIEYWKFHNTSIADAIIHFAREARALIPAERKIGVFFGYHFISWNRLNSYGHLEYEKVYASPDINFFISPGCYSNRGIGGGSGAQAMYTTALLNGKQFIHEVDFTPHDYHTRKAGWETVEDDIAGNTREACFALINHVSYWWFDMWGGFYDNPVLRERIGHMAKLHEQFKDDRSPSVAQILLVGDPMSNYYIRDDDPVTREGTEIFRNKLSVTGAAYDCCSFSDLEKLDLSQYKVIMFPQLFLIDEARAQLLREKVCQNGRTVLFAYVPGICDGRTFDTQRVETWAGVPYVRGKEGINETQMDGWKSVYASEAKMFTKEVIREVCEKAGVHFYLDEMLPVFANERLISVHCKDGGIRTVRLPKKASKVVDLLTGEVVAKNTKSFKIEMASPDTKLYEIVK